MTKKRIRRGDIFFANLDPVVGSEQGNDRPVLIVQNDIGDAHSPTVIIAPLTKNLHKKQLPTHVLIPKLNGLEADSMVLAEQIRTIDRSRLSHYVGRIGRDLQAHVDNALAICIGLERKRPAKGELLELSLCSRCEGDFGKSGYLLVKKGWQAVKEQCDFCKVENRGLSFGIFNLDKKRV